MENKPFILVTGAAGFIGTRFVCSCNERGLPVISVDKPAHFTDRTEHSGVHYGEIVDREQLQTWLDRNRPRLSAIVHLGACTRTTELNVEFLDKVNVEYSKALWTYATAHQVPFVYASSAATYGSGDQGYDDNEAAIPRLTPLNPYGESKRLFDLWALEQESRKQAPPSWSGFKFFNVYGPGERHKGMMASVVLHAFDQIRKTGKVQLFKSYRAGIADGDQKRDFIFVDDVVQVLHLALTRPIQRGIYNLGTGKARSYQDLVRAVFQAMNRKESIEFIEMPAALKDRYQYFTEARMERLRQAGYGLPFTSLEEGVGRYIQELLA